MRTKLTRHASWMTGTSNHRLKHRLKHRLDRRPPAETEADHLSHLQRPSVSANLPFVTTYRGILLALGEEKRVRILERLAASPASVGELADELPISRPAVSQHLRVLQQQALVSHRAAGTRNIYRVEPEGLTMLRLWLDDIWSTAFDSFVDYATDQSKETT